MKPTVHLTLTPKEINLPIIKQRWPDIYDQLIWAEPIPYRISQTPAPTLIINDKHLTSGYNRLSEAQLQISPVKVLQSEVWVYGPALGDTVNALLSNPILERINVVIMSRAVTMLSLEMGYQASWLSDKRVKLHLAKDFKHVVIPLVHSPSELFMVDRDAQPLRDALVIQVNRDFVNFYLDNRNKMQMASYQQNKALVDNDQVVDKLFGAWKGYRVAVIMGGPSSRDWYNWIKDEQKAHGDLFIICATTCVKPLLDADIVPAIVMCEDPMPCVESHFDGVDCERLKDTRLVYIPSAHPNLFTRWQGGERFRSKHGILDGDKDCLFLGGSVLHTSMDLAVKLGARAIYLFGGDLCYANNKTHVDGTYQSKQIEGSWHPVTTNGFGEDVFTENNLIQYRQSLQLFVKAVAAEVPDPPVFYKAGKAGVPIDGMQWLEDLP